MGSIFGPLEGLLLSCLTLGGYIGRGKEGVSPTTSGPDFVYPALRGTFGGVTKGLCALMKLFLGFGRGLLC